MTLNLNIKRNIWFLIFSSILLFSFTYPAHAATIQVDPRATFLHTNNDPFALDPVIVDLGNFGITVGDTVRMSYFGNFSFYHNKVVTGVPLCGIFSSSETVLPSSASNRIPNAVDTGPDVFTVPTYFGGDSTDIPGDFGINRFGEGRVAARYLILGYNDSYFGDNRYVLPDGSLSTSPDGLSGTYGLNFAKTNTARVPEPTTFLLLGSGLVVIGGLLRRKLRE